MVPFFVNFFLDHKLEYSFDKIVNIFAEHYVPKSAGESCLS